MARRKNVGVGPLEKRKCVRCHKEFSRRKSIIKYNEKFTKTRDRFCTKKCAYLSAWMWKKGVWFNCLECGRRDYVSVSQKKYYPSSGRFCTRSCRLKYYRADPKRHPCYKENKKLDVAGYRIVRIHKNGRNMPVREHRYVMEQFLGRELGSQEIVHHVNHDKTDNRIQNLLIMNSREHHHLHSSSPEGREMCKKAQKLGWLAHKKNMLGRWCNEHERCSSCGTKQIRHQAKGLCKRCYLKQYGIKLRARLKELGC